MSADKQDPRDYCAEQGVEEWVAEPSGALAYNENLERLLGALRSQFGALAPAVMAGSGLTTKALNRLRHEQWAAACSALSIEVEASAERLSLSHTGGLTHPLDALALRGSIARSHGLRRQVAAWVDRRREHYEAQPAAVALARRGHWDRERAFAASIRTTLKRDDSLRGRISGALHDGIAEECALRSTSTHGARWERYRARCVAAISRPEVEWLSPDDEVLGAAGQAGVQEAERARAYFLSIEPYAQDAIEARLLAYEVDLDEIRGDL